MNQPRDPAPFDLRRLQLDSALRLLAQSGHVLPAGMDFTPQWLQSLIDELCDLSSRDALTGLANRRTFELALEREIDRVARAGEPALMLMIDIDHFKAVNDLHGHAAGDLVLKAVAKALSASVRPMDTVARFGGEEFAIILPNCPTTFGEKVAERVRHGVCATLIDAGPELPLQVTISVGGAFAPQWVRSSAPLWIERADRQLYQAKAGGRNRAYLEHPPAPQVSAEEKSLLFSISPFEDPE